MSYGVLDVYYIVDCPQDDDYIESFQYSLQETLVASNHQGRDWDIRFNLLTCGKAPKLYQLEHGMPVPALTGEKKFYIGGALRLLAEALENNDATSKYCPVIVFGSPRFPYDDFVDELYHLKHSKYYDEAVKIGLSLGGSYSYPLMKLLCKYDEAIITTSDLSLFGRLFNVKEKIREEYILVKVDPPGHGEDAPLTGDVILPPDGDIPGDDEGW